VRNKPDLVSSKLPALHYYQLSLPAPSPPRKSFDPAAAKRGEEIFNGKGAKCADCHVPPTYSEPGFNMHRPSENCTDAFQASRSPDGMYRTTPLRGLWAHAKGGYWHDGRFQNLGAVVDHYNDCFKLGLGSRQKRDLVEFLKSR
jgi:cytochrome c peroxidase